MPPNNLAPRAACMGLLIIILAPPPMLTLLLQAELNEAQQSWADNEALHQTKIEAQHQASCSNGDCALRITGFFAGALFIPDVVRAVARHSGGVAAVARGAIRDATRAFSSRSSPPPPPVVPINYSHTSVQSLVAQRGGFLVVFLLSLSLTSVVLSGFQRTLGGHLELSYFLPLLVGHGGNAGGQALGSVLGALGRGEVGPRDWLRVVGKEAAAGLGTGSLACAAMLPLLRGMRISAPVTAAVLVTLPLLTVRELPLLLLLLLLLLLRISLFV